MCPLVLGLLAPLLLPALPLDASQNPSRTLVAVLAHADDELAVAPILARYAREGVRVYLVVATDGAQGGSNTTIPRGPELARARAEESKCSATAMGAAAPILLGYPDAKLGDYLADPPLLPRLTQQIADEMARLKPDVVLSWGPDGGTGHPDHRLVGDIVTQLVRAGAPGVPDRLFYMYLPAGAIRAANPARGAPPLLIPQEKYFTTRISFAPEDLKAWERVLACHETQFTAEQRQRITGGAAATWNGVIALVPAFPVGPGTDLFR